MAIEVKTHKNQELTKLIGRRLRESFAGRDDGGLPVAIADGLELLRQAESHFGREDAETARSGRGDACGALALRPKESRGPSPQPIRRKDC